MSCPSNNNMNTKAGRLMNHILRVPEGPVDGPHIPEIDLARLVDGQVTAEERSCFMAHLAGCAECYEVLAETLADVPETPAEQEGTKRTWRIPYALAASIAAVVLIGGALLLGPYWLSGPMTAEVAMTDPIRFLLMENDQQTWQSAQRIDRLAQLLREQGLEVEKLDKVVMVAAYQPKKSFFGPREKLKVKIEKGTAYLEVEEEKETK